MTRIKKIAAIVLLVLGVALAVVAWVTPQKLQQPEKLGLPASQVAQVSIVVLARDVVAGHVLEQADLTLKSVEQRPAQGFDSVSSAVGRSAAVELAQGATLTTSDLMEGLAGMLAEGERAVSIKVDEASAVGHKLQPGDWVDVFAVLRRDNQEVGATQARMLLPKKKVLAYGAQLHPQAQAAQDKAKDGNAADKQAPSPARTAVIAVQVEEVNRLLLVEQQGQVQLALRSPLDLNAPSSDKLKQIAGLGLQEAAAEGLSKNMAALDASLTALTLADITQDATAKPLGISAVSAVKATHRKALSTTGGASVEVIRGTRKETLKY
jgi:pilus assembly protein CpaB